MSDYTLKDTGYANISGAGTVETKAYSGNALPISINNLTWDEGANTSDDPNPGRYATTEINYASFNNPKLSLSGVICIDDANCSTKVKGYSDMMRTKGLKLFYYTSSTDGFNALTNVFGSATFGSLQVDGTTKALLVRVLSFRLTEEGTTASTKGLRRFSMTLEVTNPST